MRDAIFESGGLASAGAEGVGIGAGDGGGIFVEGAESLLVSGVDTGTSQASGLFARVGTNGTGDGGDIHIDAKSVLVENGGLIDARTFGSGPAGNINIENASTVEVAGGVNGPSQIGASGDLGDGGTITIHTDALKLTSGGVIQSDTAGRAPAGDVKIFASTVELDGMTRGTPSAIISLTNGGDGAAGNISIEESKSVKISDGALISANSENINSGPSGNITIETGRLMVKDSRGGDAGGGAIQANSISNRFDAGKITIEATESVALDDSSISTSSLSRSGGDIEIQAVDYIDLLDSEVTARVHGEVPGDIRWQRDAQLGKRRRRPQRDRSRRTEGFRWKRPHSRGGVLYRWRRPSGGRRGGVRLGRQSDRRFGRGAVRRAGDQLAS